MKKTIDCLFIGHNDMDIEKYESYLRRMGVTSGAYRDFNLNFVWHKNKPYIISDIFNSFYYNNDFSNGTDKPLRMGETFSAAIAYLGTYLHRRGFTFDFVNAFQFEKEELKEKLKQENILTIGIITTYYVFALPIYEIVEFIRKYNKTAKIIIGGPYIFSQVRTQKPDILETLFHSLDADYYVYSSQGETTLVKILTALKNNLPVERINNIYYKTDNGYVGTPLLKENNKLSENMVDWSLFSHKVEGFADIRTTISCPFSCAFCGFPEHAGKYQVLSVEEVESELRQLAKIESLKGIPFCDDTFNVPAQRFKGILRMMIKNKFKFKWTSNFRSQFADREMIELMKESGCQGVFLGIESANNQILKNMNKVATVEKYLNGMSLLKEYDIMTFASFVIGFPGETSETVRDTLNFINQSGVDFFRVHAWYFEHITPIWRDGEKYDLTGGSYEWTHKTMDSKTAFEIVYDIFNSIDDPVWVPQYNFEFDHLWRLPFRGMDREQIKKFIRSFNMGVREKLQDPSRREMSPEVTRRIKKSCRRAGEDSVPIEEDLAVTEDYGVKFNF